MLGTHKIYKQYGPQASSKGLRIFMKAGRSAKSFGFCFGQEKKKQN